MLDEAEVIVVGHLVGEPTYVEHQRAPDEGRSWEFHARLAIDEVLKGKCAEHEIPIILHYGLSPSHYMRDSKPVSGGWEKWFPGQGIWDSGSSAVSSEPILQDAEKPAIWFLGHYADRFGRADRPTEELGVRDPEQLRPIELLPLVRTLLEPEAVEKQLPFLHDTDASVRRECLLYLTQRREARAFPAVAELLKDESLKELAVEACVACGGKAAIPYLRPLLADETAEMCWSVSGALAKLGDTDSLPRFVEILQSGRTASSRSSAARALGRLHDVQAMPALLAALKQGGRCPGPSGREVWYYAQEAIQDLTYCTLSPNGDKAERWWQVAQGLSPDAWRHFEMARLIDSIPVSGPDAQDRANWQLAATTHWRLPGDRRYFWWPREYAPEEGERLWRGWLERQGWTDYQALPSQTDDELTLQAEPTATPESGQPVRLRYTVTNRSDHEVWLTKQCYELLQMVYPKGGGSYGSEGEYDRPTALTEADFFRLQPGNSRMVVGEAILLNKPGRAEQLRPAMVCPGLVFDRKGTSVGLDAWVGEVWAAPVQFAPLAR